MTSFLEVQARMYWRTLRALRGQAESGSTADEMHDNLDELDTIVALTTSPHLRALCVGALSSFITFKEGVAAPILCVAADAIVCVAAVAGLR